MKNPWTSNAKLEQAPLFPLVDILFAAAGIFLILIAVTQMLKGKILLPPRNPDVVVVCIPQEDRYLVFSRENPEPLKLMRFELSKYLNQRITHIDQILSLMVAFESSTFYERNLIKNLLRRIRRSEVQENDAIPKIGIEIMWWPMSGPDDLPPVFKGMA